MEKSNENDRDQDRFIPIEIDNKPYKAPKTPMTGAELRALAHPPIGPERDLFRVVPGPEDDVKVGNSDPVDLKPGMHFYSAPTSINPGGTRNAPSGR